MTLRLYDSVVDFVNVFRPKIIIKICVLLLIYKHIEDILFLFLSRPIEFFFTLKVLLFMMNQDNMMKSQFLPKCITDVFIYFMIFSLIFHVIRNKQMKKQ